MTKYLVNAFSLNMLDIKKKWHHLKIEELTSEEFCKEISDSINAIGHQGTIDLINKLCGTQLKVNRTSIKLADNDVLLIIQITERLPEGAVLKKEEVLKLLTEGKIKFLKIYYTNVYY